MDRRGFVRTAGGILVAAGVGGCGGTVQPTATGTIRIVVTGLDAAAAGGGTATGTLLEGTANPVTVTIPATGTGETPAIAVGRYRIDYTAPAGHVLASGTPASQEVVVAENQVTTVTFAVAVVVGTGMLRITVAGLTASAADGGSAQVTRVDIAGQSPQTVSIPKAGTIDTTVAPGTYRVQYSAPAGFVLAPGATNPADVPVAKDQTGTAQFQVQVASTSVPPDIKSIDFEDGTGGGLTDGVNQPISTTLISSADAARGTRCLSLPAERNVFYLLANPITRSNLYLRFALKHTDHPTTLQKVLRFDSSTGPNGTFIFSPDLPGFQFTFDFSGAVGGSTVAFTSAVPKGAWHWWEFFIDFREGVGGKAYATIWLDDAVLWNARASTGTIPSSAHVRLIQFDGTINPGNTRAFDTRFDEIGVSTKRMGIPP